MPNFYVTNTNSTGSYSIGITGTVGAGGERRVAYKNGIQQTLLIGQGGLEDSSGQPSIGAARDTSLPAGAEDFTTRNYAWAFIGGGLTDQNHVDLNTAIVKFQTTLGRNV